MALFQDKILTRLCAYSVLFIVLSLHSTFAVHTYEVQSGSAPDSIQDALNMDMVFLYKNEEEHARRKRNVNASEAAPTPEPSSVPVAESKEKEPRDGAASKKVPSGFNGTSSGAPLDGVFPEKKSADKQNQKVKELTLLSILSTTAQPPSTIATTGKPTAETPRKEVKASDASSTLAAQVDLVGTDSAVDHSSEDSQDDGYPTDVNNVTLSQNGINVTKEDSHQYYDSKMVTNASLANQLWVDMSSVHPNLTVNDLLSKAHRRAITVRMPFDFPFYGHLVRNVTIATGGFLYMGDYVHSWLAATQYIAPLMANFDTSLSNESYVKYLNNGTSFTVEWTKVPLQDKPKEGFFTFQATLHKTGNIVFVYRNIPNVDIKDDHHPVKVGLSDAYIIDRTIFFVRRKTIYEYHRVNFSPGLITNGTVIYLSAKPTCLDFKDCTSCLTHNTTFECTWCVAANRCSNGMDRHRQTWLQSNCDRSSNASEDNIIVHDYNCPAKDGKLAAAYSTTPPPVSLIPGPGAEFSEPIFSRKADEKVPESHSVMQNKAPDEGSHLGVFGVVGIMFLVAVLCTGLWAAYAYRNPHTASGQFLIRHRPANWSWRRGEARYTAATIHM